MARKREKPTFNVAGVSIKEIINLDYRTINKMGENDIVAIGNRLVSASNKRIRRLQESKYAELIPALGSLKKKGINAFSMKNKDRDKALEEVTSMIKFLKLDTSSLKPTETNKGYVKTRKDVYKRLGIKEGHWSIEEEKKFWEEYRKLEEQFGGESAVKHYDSANVQKTFRIRFDRDRLKNGNVNIVEFATELYEKKELEDSKKYNGSTF